MRFHRFFLILFVFMLITGPAFSQSSYLQSGPMVGYSEMREVLLWVQTNASARVKFIYWDIENPDRTYSTDEPVTEKKKAFTAKVIADSVRQGKKYEYELYLNDQPVELSYPLKFQTQKLWQWREDPPEFRFVFGSGTFVNDRPDDRPEPYGGEYEIFEAVCAKQPDFVLWLGDNIYLREPDWNTRTGILYRNTHTRSLPELQPLLGSVHHYAIWDDHDFGPDNSDRSFWNKQTTLEAFKLFWGNPSFGINGQPGTTTTFSWGDAQFFLLDNRYYRSANHRKTGDRTVLGKEQFEWLIDALKFSRATFKFIAMGGQFLSPVTHGENYINYPEERAALLRAIETEGINGVIFLTGDRHFSELSKLERYHNYPLYEFTASPFTSGPNPRDEPNYLRLESTLVQERNFGLIEVSGQGGERSLKFSVYDKNGDELWTRIIHEDEIK